MASSFFGEPETLVDDSFNSDNPFCDDLYRSICEDVEDDLAPIGLRANAGFQKAHQPGDVHGHKPMSASFPSLKSLSLDHLLADKMFPEQPHAKTSWLQRELPFQVNPDKVAPFPIYHERYSSFVSKAPLQEIISVIASQLELMDRVDFSYNSLEHSIRGVSYHENASTSWKFRVYEGKEENTYLCEFQRRSGCGIGFRYFYQDITRACACLQAPVATPPVKRSVPKKESLPAPQDSEKSTPDLCPILCKSVADWIGSQYLDVKVEGFRFLASLSRQTENQQLLVESTELLKTLSSGPLVSTDIELQRLSMQILGDLCRNPHLQRDIADTFLDPIFRILEEPSSYLKLDTQRNALGCLLALASNEAIRKSKLVEPTSRSRCRRTLLSISEPSLLELCERTLLAMN